MKLSQIALVIMLSAVTAFAVGKYTAAPAPAAAKQETAYQRVLKSNTLRCGYIPYSYAFRLDPNTGKMSGVMYDVVEEIGRLNHIKIDWAEELTWATVATSIETGRVDALCSGIWIETQNAKFMAYSTPLYYNSIGVYARANEDRFHKLSDLNAPNVRFITRDGGTPEVISRQDFPAATQVSLPSGISDGELIESITSGKADILLYGDDFLSEYVIQNPTKLKNIFPNQKVRIYPLAMGLPMLDVGLKNMIDSTLEEMRGSKFIERSLKKNAPEGSWVPDLSALKEDK
ncbi:MAG: transporter substrate-binding domain-containing protein [Alphaproteobacteria bacterium]|nr:transporter substrate-binding domain-containing protein [Alphaproteobacteria bacterium]